MDPYDKLDDETLCFALVGQFMWHWSMLENTVDEALGNALDLSYMQMTVLSDHINFMGKLKILTGAITIATFNADQRRDFHATVDSLTPLYRDRNVVAHHLFGPIKDRRGVTFFTRQTKKTVRLSEEFWSEEECEMRFRRLEEAERSVRDLSRGLERHKTGLVSQIAKKLAPDMPYGERIMLERKPDIVDLLRGVPSVERDEMS